MTQRVLSFTTGLAALLITSTASLAGKVSFEVTLPDPVIEEIQINGHGDVTSLKFSDGEVVQNPTVDLKDMARIDLLEFYNLMFDILIAQELNGGSLFLCIKYPDTSCRRSLVDDYLTLMLDQSGQITEVLDPEGNDVSEPPFNLSEEDIDNLHVLDIRTYRLIEFRDLTSGDTLRRIVQPAL